MSHTRVLHRPVVGMSSGVGAMADMGGATEVRAAEAGDLMAGIWEGMLEANAAAEVNEVTSIADPAFRKALERLSVNSFAGSTLGGGVGTGIKLQRLLLVQSPPALLTPQVLVLGVMSVPHLMGRLTRGGGGGFCPARALRAAFWKHGLSPSTQGAEHIPSASMALWPHPDTHLGPGPDARGHDTPYSPRHSIPRHDVRPPIVTAFLVPFGVLESVVKNIHVVHPQSHDDVERQYMQRSQFVHIWAGSGNGQEQRRSQG